ncbi:Protein CBG13337 [Caenorhabditis briggsae]|uniref:Uncharacterized protein n=2 Tax=Caenorhabditis briggsae TaxID=6238 RepID=A0AAE9EAG1_CAEBR|nr:Protein CBG13337 [Caenorhabditis briggsae]ULU04316.1 hypothetical protein L3Y34_017236 [Caenorhabditis briggsae]UMM16318.1 hypothetical protein L5515_013378 [Caenorhabditis briggsae]CAP32272.2 Protein CBG13337 [Caenorhabditis briggsae]
MRLLIFSFGFLVVFVESEAIKQCLCKPYEKCLMKKGVGSEPVDKCFSKCEKIFPTCSFVSCMRQFIPDFNKIKQCSYSAMYGFRGCTSQKMNVLGERSMEEFRDIMISTVEENIGDFDETREFMNKKAARQAECVFECLYPGRNYCTRKLKCDVYLPPEDEFFKSFYSCAQEKQLFSKSEQMYACISKLFVTSDKEEPNRRRS